MRSIPVRAGKVRLLRNRVSSVYTAEELRQLLQRDDISRHTGRSRRNEDSAAFDMEGGAWLLLNKRAKCDALWMI
jgi:hypothetical protein